MWSLNHITQDILNQKNLMSAALHSLLSSKDIFKAECGYVFHLASNSIGNGYLTLYHIVQMVHPILGQATTQPSQPSQKKTYSFSEHVSNSIDYFQSEACSGHIYSLNEQVVLILSRLHPLWRNTIKHKYTQLVP
jgi:hypothetical protein